MYVHVFISPCTLRLYINPYVNVCMCICGAYAGLVSVLLPTLSSLTCLFILNTVTNSFDFSVSRSAALLRLCWPADYSFTSTVNKKHKNRKKSKEIYFTEMLCVCLKNDTVYWSFDMTCISDIWRFLGKPAFTQQVCSKSKKWFLLNYYNNNNITIKHCSPTSLFKCFTVI